MPAAVDAAEQMARPDARSQLAGLLVINAFTEPPRRAVAYATVDSPATTAPKTNDPAVPHNCTTGRCASAAATGTCRVVHVERRPKQSATRRASIVIVATQHDTPHSTDTPNGTAGPRTANCRRPLRHRRRRRNSLRQSRCNPRRGVRYDHRHRSPSDVAAHARSDATMIHVASVITTLRGSQPNLGDCGACSVTVRGLA